MKKSLLTLGVVAAVAAGTSAQGTLGILNPSSAGFNTATSNPASLTGWYTGNLTMLIYTIPAAGNASLVNLINTDEQNFYSSVSGVDLIADNPAWTLQDSLAPNGTTEAATQKVSISNGILDIASEGYYTIGTSATLSPTADIYYALVFLGGPDGNEGAVVLNGIAGYTPGTVQDPVNTVVLWPVNQQNLYLAPFPEPTTLTLSGLAGLSMLFLRRRKS